MGILLGFSPDNLSQQGVAVLAVTLWVAIWWITEAIPISVTALLPIVLLPLFGGVKIGDVTASYGHKYIFLYMGGFILAIAIERWNLHRRIALNIIYLVGNNVPRIILGFMLSTAFLSMWISNTATTVMMLPIGVAVASQFLGHSAIDVKEGERFSKALMLAIAYSASIGGMATLIGTPPNLVLAGILQQIYGIDISFATWFMFGFPISVVLLTICWVYLTRFAFACQGSQFPGGRQEIARLRAELGSMSYEEKVVLTVFVGTAFLWVFRSYLQNFVPQLDDTIIAISAASVLFMLSSKDRKQPIMTWEEAVRMPWGTIVLFGGGIAIAGGFQKSGLASWIGQHLVLLEALPLFLLVAILIAAVNFLTEITSNLATTTVLLPILAPMALALDVHPYTLMVAVTVAASCAYMLPVATPPNAIVFGSGYLKIADMFKTGIWMNFISIILLTLAVYFLLPALWGFELNVFPAEFKS
ncbi:sodium-dependent dicarboxylate transporter SdcS [Alteromonas lipolytica]|nr:sodium-dependent dicarboxylate transporter SdcS [Alteromonas lipolytica]